MMTKLSIKTYALLCLLLNSIGALAQADSKDFHRRGETDDYSVMNETTDNLFFHFTTFDVVMFIVILVACYVYGKIWKGCTYLILVLAALFYFLLKS